MNLIFCFIIGFIGGFFFSTAISVSDKTQTVSPDEVRGVGKWIKIDRVADMEAFKCSACGSYVHVSTVYEKPMYEYCPMCGAKMEVSEDA